MANSFAPNTILLAAGDERMNSQGVKEELATAAITPGHLVERDATGIAVHSTAQGRNQRLFALENVADAKGIDDDYVAGEIARMWQGRPGDEIFGLVLNGTAAIALNDDLASNGDGTLVTVTDTVDAKPLDGVVVARALEAVDNSGGGAPVRIKAEVV